MSPWAIALLSGGAGALVAALVNSAFNAWIKVREQRVQMMGLAVRIAELRDRQVDMAMKWTRDNIDQPATLRDPYNNTVTYFGRLIEGAKRGRLTTLEEDPKDGPSRGS